MSNGTISTRDYNAARELWKRLDRERIKLEALEDIEHDARLVEIQDEQHRLMQIIQGYKAQQRALAH